MLIFALALVAPTALTETHQRDISCVVEIAVLANAQRGVSDGDVRASGRRWAGIVGDRITAESGQPRELVAIAMTEAAKARAARADDTANLAACIRQMNGELAIADAATAPLPKPVKAQ
jgi:hypothetical protein